MRLHEAGVSDKSTHWFSSPSPLAQRILHYPIALGHFFTKVPYNVVRLDFNSYLLLEILSGTLSVQIGDSTREVTAGNILLIDCHIPHRYFTNESCEFLFLHFDGSNSNEFFREITERSGCMFACPAVHAPLERILSLYAGDARPNESEVSVLIHTILCTLLQGGTGYTDNGANETPVRRAERYIHTHLNEPLTVAELARLSGHSESWFSRNFSVATGFSPYRYVLLSRIDKAKQLLSATEMSVSAIAEAVGFSNAEGFINAFTRIVGMSPRTFRRQPL